MITAIWSPMAPQNGCDQASAARQQARYRGPGPAGMRHTGQEDAAAKPEEVHPMEIDPRGPRFGAVITMIVFAVVLLTGSVWLLAVQALFFAIGTVFGLPSSPYGLVYRWLVRPRLGPPGELEPAAPPRFAQGVGLVISVVGVIGYAVGVEALGQAAAAAGFVAAFLNGIFGLCLGCEMYLLIRRIRPGRQRLTPAEADKEVAL
jgi:hypothetical protein